VPRSTGASESVASSVKERKGDDANELPEIDLYEISFNAQPGQPRREDSQHQERRTYPRRTL
jgi:hypothetical protein